MPLVLPVATAEYSVRPYQWNRFVSTLDYVILIVYAAVVVIS